MNSSMGNRPRTGSETREVNPLERKRQADKMRQMDDRETKVIHRETSYQNCAPNTYIWNTWQCGGRLDMDGN